MNVATHTKKILSPKVCWTSSVSYLDVTTHTKNLWNKNFPKYNKVYQIFMVSHTRDRIVSAYAPWIHHQSLPREVYMSKSCSPEQLAKFINLHHLEVGNRVHMTMPALNFICKETRAHLFLSQWQMLIWSRPKWSIHE